MTSNCYCVVFVQDPSREMLACSYCSSSFRKTIQTWSSCLAAAQPPRLRNIRKIVKKKRKIYPIPYIPPIGERARKMKIPLLLTSPSVCRLPGCALCFSIILVLFGAGGHVIALVGWGICARTISSSPFCVVVFLQEEVATLLYHLEELVSLHFTQSLVCSVR